jgi:hypothetical protein
MYGDLEEEEEEDMDASHGTRGSKARRRIRQTYGERQR